jgi:flagellar assembly protein FliH
MSTNATFSSLTYPSLLTAGAEEEIERARVHGHAAGYAAGLRAAEAEAALLGERARLEREALRSDAATALASALSALEAAAQRVSETSELVLADADASLTAAAIELAESILGRELSSDASSARAAIARVLSVVDEQPVLDVRLSPVDLAVITAGDLFPARVQLIGDASLERGDAVVDVPSGRVDARISSALDRARIEIGVVR